MSPRKQQKQENSLDANKNHDCEQSKAEFFNKQKYKCESKQGSTKRPRDTTEISVFKNSSSNLNYDYDATNKVIRTNSDYDNTQLPASSSFHVIETPDGIVNVNSCEPTDPLTNHDQHESDGEETSSESEDFDYEPVLTQVLNEKKLVLARSPEVIKFLSDISSPPAGGTRHQ